MVISLYVREVMCYTLLLMQGGIFIYGCRMFLEGIYYPLSKPMFKKNLWVMVLLLIGGSGFFELITTAGAFSWLSISHSEAWVSGCEHIVRNISALTVAIGITILFNAWLPLPTYARLIMMGVLAFTQCNDLFIAAPFPLLGLTAWSFKNRKCLTKGNSPWTIPPSSS